MQKKQKREDVQKRTYALANILFKSLFRSIQINDQKICIVKYYVIILL